MAALLGCSHLPSSKRSPGLGKDGCVSQLWVLGLGQVYGVCLRRTWTFRRQEARVSMEPSRSEERWLAVRLSGQTPLIASQALPFQITRSSWLMLEIWHPSVPCGG